MLTEADKAFFMDMEDLFNRPGWARLTQGWKNEADKLPEAMFYNAKTPEDMLTFRVRMELLRELISLPDAIQRAKAEKEQDTDSEDE